MSNIIYISIYVLILTYTLSNIQCAKHIFHAKSYHPTVQSYHIDPSYDSLNHLLLSYRDLLFLDTNTLETTTILFSHFSVQNYKRPVDNILMIESKTTKCINILG